MSTKFNDEPEKASRPFDNSRDGFVYVLERDGDKTLLSNLEALIVILGNLLFSHLLSGSLLGYILQDRGRCGHHGFRGKHIFLAPQES